MKTDSMAPLLTAVLTAACVADSRDHGVDSFTTGASVDDDAGADGGDTTGADDGDGGADEVTGTDSGGSDETGGGADGSDDTAGDGDTGGPQPDPGLSGCSKFSDANGFFGLINSIRADYGGEGIYLPHGRYKGLPWQGQGHEDWTFSTQFVWDDALAATAQDEADRLASGASPRGNHISGQAAIHNPFWIDGVNTAQWMITAWEQPGDWVRDPNNPFSSDVPFALDKSNGSARQGLHYHDFGGDGPAINRLGVGGALGQAENGDCRVWWVLQFGP